MIRGEENQERNTGAFNGDSDLFRQGNPWRITTDLNEACNIQCSYCHVSALSGAAIKNSRVLDPTVVGDLLNDADNMKVFDVTLTGGEVTIMPNFSEYLEKVNDLDFTSVQVITNGTMLATRRTMARDMKDAGVSRVSISVDGPEESHDLARGQGTWRRAWRGIENAIDAGLPVNVISVLGTHNIDDWHELTPTLKDAGVRSQNVSLMCRLGRAESADDWMGVPVERLSEVQKRQAELEESFNDETFFTFLNDGVLKAPGWEGKPTPIHAFQDQNPGIEAVVKVDGSILRNRLYGMNRIVGNIGAMSLSDIWNVDRPERQSIESVVDPTNAGQLPSLYYHYDASSGRQEAEMPRPGTAALRHPDLLRVRQEPWGTVTFDPSTFSIVDISFEGNTADA